jgi:hypothetical protein
MIFRPDVRKQVQKWIGIGGDSVKAKDHDYEGDEDESQLKLWFKLIVKD